MFNRYLVGLLFCSFISMLGQAQDITGISIGMTLDEARAKLPAGFTIETPQTGFRPQFTTLYAQRAPYKRGSSDDAYTIEAVDGKVAYIAHVVTLSADKAIDKQTYLDQVYKKYGKPSPLDRRATGYGFSAQGLYWTWNQAGAQIPYLDCDGGRGGFPDGFRDDVKDPLLEKYMITAVPNQRDLPGCHKTMLVSLSRQTSLTPVDSADTIQFKLFSPDMFFDGAVRDVQADKAKQDAAKKAIQQRQGPPM